VVRVAPTEVTVGTPPERRRSIFSTEFLALLALDRLGEGYGLQIIETIEVWSKGDASPVLQGTLYPVLSEMEAKGYVQLTKEDGDETRGGRPRRYLSLTSSGKKRLLVQLTEVSNLLRGYDPSLLSK